MRASAVALAALALASAGCGGSQPPPRRTVPLTAQEREGRALFVRACGACHTLADAGTSGIAGPNLDDHPYPLVSVREAIASGPGQMPADLLTGGQADAVAAYVVAATKR